MSTVCTWKCDDAKMTSKDGPSEAHLVNNLSVNFGMRSALQSCSAASSLGEAFHQ